MKRTMLAILVCGTCACCANPVSPDPMAEWAAKHAHEVCLTFGVAGRGILAPLNSDWQSLGGTVVPISYCDPRE